MRPARRALLVWPLAAALPLRAAEPPPDEVAAELPGAALQGRATLRFAGLRIYDARLWSGERVAAERWAGQPLALELLYARALQGRRIADRSLHEMRRQRAIDDATEARWRDAMGRLFPDVAAGDRLTGVLRPAEGARFFHNGRLRGELREAEFARLFFGIWLAPQTSEPALRDALLGSASAS